MKLHIAALLIIFWLGIFTVDTVGGSIGSQSMHNYSCVDLKVNRLHIKNLISYKKIQGPVEAIVFVKKGGVHICVKPDHPQAQNAMKKINERRTTKGR